MSGKTGIKASDKTIGPETCNVDNANIVTGTRMRNPVPRSSIMSGDVSSDEEEEFEEEEVEDPPSRKRITNQTPMSVINRRTQDHTAEDEDEDSEPLPVKSVGPMKKNVSSENIASRTRRASEAEVITISSHDEGEACPPKGGSKTFESQGETAVKEPKRRASRTSIVSLSIDDNISDAPPKFGKNTFGIHKGNLIKGPRKRNSETGGLAQNMKSKKGSLEQGLSIKTGSKTSNLSSEYTVAVSTRRKSEASGFAPKAGAMSEAKTRKFPSKLDLNTVRDFANVSTAPRMQSSRSSYSSRKAGDSPALIGSSFSKISLENVTGGKRRRNFGSYGGGSLISSEDEDEGSLGVRGTRVREEDLEEEESQEGEDIQHRPKPLHTAVDRLRTNTVISEMAGPETRRNNPPNIPLETDKTYTSPSWPDTVDLIEHRTRRGLIVGWHVQYPQQRDGLRIEARLGTATTEIYFLPITPRRDNPFKGEINGLLKRIGDGGHEVDSADVLLDPQLFPRFDYGELQTVGGEKRQEAMDRLLDIFMESEG
ncbi:hypothetical protein HYALB_00004523 [Hymenoscyphus albidus]|uniref:Uncharacterized protein n=1 Tax=Hymenoscyphus albidus TaxID=595503 RepID=A0A9N9QBP0_9HELO|nr:hypothetical protein HYALB_00004523 [Hymenoscyphus albidus]